MCRAGVIHDRAEQGADRRQYKNAAANRRARSSRLLGDHGVKGTGRAYQATGLDNPGPGAVEARAGD
jgi:hypothetical protein